MADDDQKDLDTDTDDEDDSDDGDENEDADSDGDESDEEDEDDDADSEDDEDEEDDDEEDEDDAGGDDKKSKKSDKSKSKKSSKKDVVKDDDEEPARRPRSVADFVATRRAKAAKKGKEGQKGKKDGGDEDDDDADGDDEDAPLTAKGLQKALSPLMQEREETRVDSDITAFIAKHPDLKPYAAKARRFALHPHRREIPIKAIFYEVAGDDLLKIGAKKAKTADVKAKKSRTGGGSEGRDSGKGDGKGVWNLPKKDFEKMQEKARHGR